MEAEKKTRNRKNIDKFCNERRWNLANENKDLQRKNLLSHAQSSLLRKKNIKQHVTKLLAEAET